MTFLSISGNSLLSGFSESPCAFSLFLFGVELSWLLILWLSGLLLMVLRDGFCGGVEDDEFDDIGTSASDMLANRTLLAEGSARNGGT